MLCENTNKITNKKIENYNKSSQNRFQIGNLFGFVDNFGALKLHILVTAFKWFYVAQSERAPFYSYQLLQWYWCSTEVAVVDKMYACVSMSVSMSVCEIRSSRSKEKQQGKADAKRRRRMFQSQWFLAMKLKWMGSMCHCAFYIVLLQYYLRYIQKWVEHIFVGILFVFESTTKCSHNWRLFWISKFDWVSYCEFNFIENGKLNETNGINMLLIHNLLHCNIPIALILVFSRNNGDGKKQCVLCKSAV